LTRQPQIPFLDRLLAVGEGAPSLEDKLRYAAQICQDSPELVPILVNVLVEHTDRGRRSLLEAQDSIGKLKAALDKLTATPWRVGRFVRLVSTSCGDLALVRCGNSEHLVMLGDGIDADSLERGDEVFLTGDMTAIVERSTDWSLRAGETAVFDRYVPECRAAIKYRDEELVADIIGPLKGVALKSGDLVLWDRASCAICEKLEAGGGSRFLLEDTPSVPMSQVGGQDRCVQDLLSALKLSLAAPDMAVRYGLSGRQSILLWGPPGCGKTLLARVAATEIARLSRKQCRFALVKPGQWESMWVGQTEENIRNFFKSLREAAEDGFAVVFLDEIEAVGRIRGGVSAHHSDRFLAAFLAELDGFVGRGQVAIISATNRKDLIDPALLERLSDIEIQVRRPDLRGARAIIGIHLPDTIPYRSNGKSSGETREEIIETMVSRFYSPNGDNSVCTLRFRDGRMRTVAARQLASGRVLEQICRAAKRSAALREHLGGEPGICLRDTEDGLRDAIERLASTLTTRNVHAYLDDLPQDVDVVAVEPVGTKVSHEHRYLRTA
jgi:proteasome-associated ATPase